MKAIRGGSWKKWRKRPVTSSGLVINVVNNDNTTNNNNTSKTKGFFEQYDK